MDGDAHIHTHRVYISVWPLSSALLVNTGNYLVSPKLAGAYGICPVISSLKFPTVLWLLLSSSPTQTHPTCQIPFLNNSRCKSINMRNWGLCRDTLIIKHSLKEENDFTMNIVPWDLISFTMKVIISVLLSRRLSDHCTEVESTLKEHAGAHHQPDQGSSSSFSPCWLTYHSLLKPS